MNAVEIDQAVSELFQQPFDAAEFPLQFLAAFDRNETTLKRLRTGNTNRSDVAGGVLQRNHIHIAPAPEGTVDETVAALRASARTISERARYILATDGAMLHAEDVASGDVLSCTWADFPNRFGFFLPLAGITTVHLSSRTLREVYCDELVAIANVDLVERANGSGTIKFGQVNSVWGNRGMGAWSPSLDPTPQFIAIGDARRVFDLLQRSNDKQT